MIMEYHPGPCGSGKSYAMRSEIRLTHKTKKHLIVQPTVILQTETYHKLNVEGQINNDLDVQSSVRILNSTTHLEGSLLPSIKSALRDPNTRVVMITEKMFYQLDAEVLENIKVWLDDCVEFCSFRPKSVLAKDLDKFRDLYSDSVFEVIESFNTKYDVVKLKDNYDEMSDDVIDIVKRLEVASDGYNKMVVNKEFSQKPKTESTATKSDKQKSFINIVCWHDLSVYTDAGVEMCFLAANFESSLLYKHHKHLFKKGDFELQPGVDTALMDVKYFVPSESLTYGFTKAFSESEEGTKLIASMINYINQLELELFYTTNVKSNAVLNGELHKPNLRGVNNLDHMTSACWISCMNGSKNEITVLGDVFGFSSTDIKTQREYELMYQFLSRGCIRKPGNTDTMTIFVVSEDQARFLVPNPTLVELDMSLSNAKRAGRPKEAKTSLLNKEETDAFTKYKRQVREGRQEYDLETFIAKNDFTEKQVQYINHKFELFVKKQK